MSTIHRNNLPLSFRKMLLLCFLLLSATARAQYCTPAYDLGGFGNCNADDVIDDFTLNGANGTSISDLGTGCATDGYDDRTTVVPAIDLQQGATYSGTLSTIYTGNENVRIWIDFNNDQTFASSEEVGHFGPIGSGTNPNPFSISIPFSAPVASNLRMRVRLVYGGGSAGSLDPCAFYYNGETHDYSVNILLTPACSGAPTAGTVNPSGSIATCNGGVFNLSTTGTTFASGLTYEWEQSTNSGTTWGPAVGGTGGATLNYTTAPITVPTQFRLKVKCGPDSGLSTVVTITPSAPGYAALPYFQDFESWTNYCTSFDVPSQNWSNTPASGDRSWRRENQGGLTWANTWGAYYPPSVSGNHSARWHSSDLSFGDNGDLDLYLDCSNYANPNKQLYFYFINPYSYADSLTIWLSTNGGASFTQIGGYDTATDWTRKSLPIVSSSAQTILRFRGTYYGFYDFDDLGIDSVYVAAPCSGTPNAGILQPASPVAACPGGSYILSALGTSLAGNLAYQWQQSVNNGVTWTNVTTGGTSAQYTTPTLSDTIQYRLIVTCQGSSLKDTTDPLILNVEQPVYATLPYAQGFESWTTRCEPDDIPSINWTNTPSTGNQSWRRNDQGSSANWTSPNGGNYTYPSIEGSHSARFHTWYAPTGTTGALDLYVNCSPAGNKELQFFHINDVNGVDSLKVMLSTDGGQTFSQLAVFDTSTAANWTLRTVPFSSSSATTVLRFDALSDYGLDMGIDAVKVLLPCAGAPNAGAVVQMTPCSGQNFNLQLTGNTLAAGLSYQWQQSATGTGGWTNVPGGNQQIATTSITTPTYFRCIVVCTNGGLSDTTAASFFDIAAFYYCYCQSSADYAQDDDIGNVMLTKPTTGDVLLDNGLGSPLLNNSSATNVYTNFTSLPADTLFMDSTYHISVTQITSSPWVSQANVSVYIDLNRDGQFDPAAEQVMFNATDPNTQIAEGDFTISDTVQTGLTGMRIVLSQGTWTFPSPCGTYYAGETEDYLVYLSYPPCAGTPDAGHAWISDTLICPGFTVNLMDSAHSTNRAGLQWYWESSSSASGPWALLPGSENKDTFATNPTTDMYYRMRILCSYSGLESFSNTLAVKMKFPYQCYCLSFADGGASDASDAGAFSIGTFVTNTGGGHLNNPTAYKSYTDWTGTSVAQLNVSTTYDVSAYHVMRSSVHSDAKVTLFIDYDNNHQYDIPQERVWTGFTSATQPYISSTVSIPATAVQGVLTGMRLIINENTGPNVPSDEACGTYVSGETEDYVVKFYPQGTTVGVGSVPSLLDNVALFPNPTSGKFTLMLNQAKATGGLDVTISSVTGQQVGKWHYEHTGGGFRADLDMSSQPRGVYFVELQSGGDRVVRKLVLR